VDGHLGDALFRITVLVHYGVAVDMGWKGLWEQREVVPERPYQVRVDCSSGRVWLFAPSGPGHFNFRQYVSRINATGWKGLFPSGARMAGLYLAGADLTNLFAYESDLTKAMLQGANLSGAIFFSAIFDDAVLDGISAFFANFRLARLDNASLDGASLGDAQGLEQVQIDSAQGDERTKLPPGMERPARWLFSESKTTATTSE
jgi:hypothetical protein